MLLLLGYSERILLGAKRNISLYERQFKAKQNFTAEKNQYETKRNVVSNFSIVTHRCHPPPLKNLCHDGPLGVLMSLSHVNHVRHTG